LPVVPVIDEPYIELTVAPFPPEVDLTLEVTEPDGTPISSVPLGGEFVLHVYAQDLRHQPHGVFAAYLDITWNETLAVATGGLQYTGPYQTVKRGEALPGMINEAGSVAGQAELAGSRHEVFRVPLRATGLGDLTFTADPADLVPQHEILIYGKNIAVPLDVVRFGVATLRIADSPAGGSEAPLPLQIDQPSDESMAGFEIAMQLYLTAGAAPHQDEPSDSLGPTLPVVSIRGWELRVSDAPLHFSTADFPEPSLDSEMNEDDTAEPLDNEQFWLDVLRDRL